MTRRITPIEEHGDTVLLSRADYEILLDALEDAEDLAVVADRRAREAALGVEAARKRYVPWPVMERLIEGENPVRVLREHRGMTLRALAEAAKLPPGYLSEIETGRKPGSARALARLARALDVDIEDLLPPDEGED